MLARADPARAKASQWFFKTGPGQYGEGDRFLGLTLPELRQLAKEYEALSSRAIVALLKSPWHEERLLALLILVRQYATGDPAARDRIYRCYMANRARINNWDLVDASAEHIVGAHAIGGDRSVLDRLVVSESLWERRIAVISSIVRRRGSSARTCRRAGAGSFARSRAPHRCGTGGSRSSRRFSSSRRESTTTRWRSRGCSSAIART